MAYVNPDALQLIAQRNIMKARVELWVRRDKDKSFAQTVLVPIKEEGAALPEPTLSLNHDEAQMLMDELYSAGVRPTEVGSPGELGAVKSHLKDMRDIAFSLLDLKK